MLFHIFTLIITTFISAGVHCRAPSKIIGGGAVEITKYPSVVQIRKYETQFGCAGTLITNKHVLTAAHCIVEKTENKTLVRYPTSWYSVVAGETSSDAPAKLYAIERIDVHPDYKVIRSDKPDGDIAVITLKEEVETNERQRPIALATSPLKPKSRVTVVGWGVTNFETGSIGDQLKQIRLVVFERDECKIVFTPQFFPTDQFCAYDGPDVSVCHGDSGGPVYFNDEVVGIVVWAYCNGLKPSYMTDVYQYRSWIEAAIKGEAPTLSITPFS